MRPERSPGRLGPVSCTRPGSESLAAAFPGGPFRDAFGTVGRGYQPGADPGVIGEKVGKRVPWLRQPGTKQRALGWGKGRSSKRKEGFSVLSRQGPEQPPRGHLPWRGPVGAGESREPPPWAPGGPSRHGGCALELCGRGRSRGGWLPGRAEPRAASLPTAQLRRAATHLPPRLRRTV